MSMTRAQLRDLFGDDVDDGVLDRMVETGATLDDIAAAIDLHDAELRGAAVDRAGLAIRAYEVREILDSAGDRDDRASASADPRRSMRS
jgi:hypothetical protein